MNQQTAKQIKLAEMTPETAIARLRIIADLGNLPASSKHQLRLIADWMGTIEFPLPADWAERAEWLDKQRMEAEEQA